VKLALLFYVAMGGAVGALGRYLVTSTVPRYLGHGFPWGTLTVNVVGSLIMGLLVEVMARRWSVSPEIRLFFVTGMLGAFTTFSTFSLDVVTLWERGQEGAALGYTLGSVFLGVLALFIGLWLGRTLV